MPNPDAPYPSALMLYEPDTFEVVIHRDTPDSGVVLTIEDSTLAPGLGLACVTVALSANQTLGLLETFKMIEDDMRREVAEGRGGRPIARRQARGG